MTITYMKNSFCVFKKKKFMNDRPFLFLKVLNFTDFVNEIY